MGDYKLGSGLKSNHIFDNLFSSFDELTLYENLQPSRSQNMWYQIALEK